MLELLILAKLVKIFLKVPKGIYKPNEENPKEIEIDEEGKIPEQSELAALENWVHFNPNILNAGRTTHYVNQSLSDEVF